MLIQMGNFLSVELTSNITPNVNIFKKIVIPSGTINIVVLKENSLYYIYDMHLAK